ncbi:DUF418 domain-containing protein [Quadrisphaera setariae]|uniref:DUF418 domain-containing protein n=1 Tax=Quadrisphaera setariae TaxID=2593304 RepID=UPI001C9C7CB0|nr:DUF418 domain-containing protein [Quadrisphaera setariae]
MSSPLPTAERSLAPDLARGLALLGIALANAPVHLSGLALGPGGRPVEAGPADRAVDAVIGLFVDNRAFPMFTALFAFGLAVMARRAWTRGAPWPQTRGVLLRRCSWLAVFGLVHALLLFDGDILLTYGLLGLAVVALWLRASLRALLWWGGASLLVFAAFSALDGTSVAGGDDALFGLSAQTYLGGLGMRAVSVGGLVVMAPLLVLYLLPPAVLGLLAERRGVLTHPGQHLPLLRRVAVVGFAVSVAGALPLVAASLQVVSWPGWADALAGALHGLTGLAGAMAFLAGVAWIVAVRRPSGVLAGALVAVGRRSLTCYLLQSLVMAPLLAPWGLGLGAGTGTAVVSAVAVATYLLTVVVAVALERAGRPGPAEALLRRLTYGPRRERVADTGAAVRPVGQDAGTTGS